MKLYLQSVKDPALRYEVLQYDPENKQATLKGQYAAFEIKPFTKERIEKDGYKLIKEQ